MKTDIWMPVYIGDYLGDTQHLSAEKHGIYFLLMMHYWKQGPLENDLDELSCVARTSEEKVIKILKEFFSLERGVWIHGRIDKEKAKAKGRSEAAKAKAKKRWEDKKKCTDNATADAPADPEADATASGEQGKTMLNGCSSSSSSSLSSKSQSQSEEKRGKRASRFSPPTVEEVQSYCQERGNQVNPVRFVNFYGAKGWMIGKNKMKNWKQAVITWESNDRDKKPDQYNLGVARVEGF